MASGARAYQVHVVLFRRDLRVEDHEILSRMASLSSDSAVRLLPLFVYDPTLLKDEYCSTAHHLFIGDCLDELDRRLTAMGSGLVVRIGHICGILTSLHRQYGKLTLHSHHITGTLVERNDDAATRRWCAEHSIDWHEVPANGVWPCTQRACFQDWLTTWGVQFDEHCAAPCHRAPASLPALPPGVRRGQRPSLEAIVRLGATDSHRITAATAQRGGSRAAAELLASFVCSRGLHYRSQLSSPVTAAKACSRLSPHLAWGSLSIRQVSHALLERLATLRRAGGCSEQSAGQGGPSTTQGVATEEGSAAEAAEAATGRGALLESRWRPALEAMWQRVKWRAHNMQKFEATPSSEHRNLVRGYDALRRLGTRATRGSRAAEVAAAAAAAAVEEEEATEEEATEEEEAEAERLFTAWRTGRTGYPLVDACMRCLDHTGWLTFRMRCLVVSFACYHLWLHWRRPAVWLAQRFVDFEPGIHFSQVQMQAGTAGTVPAGLDPSPHSASHVVMTRPRSAHVRRCCCRVFGDAHLQPDEAGGGPGSRRHVHPPLAARAVCGAAPISARAEPHAPGRPA